MLKYRSFIVDAFASKPFAGNPAAVCLVPQKLADVEYQRIAAEFNLSETAFPLPLDSDSFKTASRFSLRWFTPRCEVHLCGHATLATSHVLLNELCNSNAKIEFDTLSGTLVVQKSLRKNGFLEMNFPQYEIASVPLHGKKAAFASHFNEIVEPPFLNDLIAAFVPSEIQVDGVAYAPQAKKLLIVLNENCCRDAVEKIKPNFGAVLGIHPNGDMIRGVAITLRPKNAQQQSFTDPEGVPYDFVSRYFAPWVGIQEDPATGSAHCALAPFWQKLTANKPLLYAHQCFPGRGADFFIELLEDNRLAIIGQSFTVVDGNIRI